MAKPKITPYQLNMYTEPISRLYRALEQDIFLMIAKRLKTSIDYSSDHVFKWQVEKMQELRLLNDDTIKLLSETTGIASSKIREAIYEVSDKTKVTVDDEIAQLKKVNPLIPLRNDNDIRLESLINQTFRELDNYVNQTLITTNFGQGTVTKLYKDIIEETVAKVLSGHMTINDAITESVIKWRKSGVKTSFIDKGNNIWHLEHYAETVLRSTVNRTYNDVRLSRMQEHDVEFVLVSSLPDAREACARIQGNVCSMNRVSSDPKYPSIYEFGYGEPNGIRGINCRHILYPFIPGVNYNNEVQYDVDDAILRGKIAQAQRRLERDIRQAKMNIELAENLGNDMLANKYRNQLNMRRAKMREFVIEHDVPRFREREQIR